MSESATQENGLSYGWLNATFLLVAEKRGAAVETMCWQVGSRLDGHILTALRVLDLGDGAFMAEVGQGERTLDEVRYPAGVGIVLESAEQLDQLVAALRLEYAR